MKQRMDAIKALAIELGISGEEANDFMTTLNTILLSLLVNDDTWNQALESMKAIASEQKERI